MQRHGLRSPAVGARGVQVPEGSALPLHARCSYKAHEVFGAFVFAKVAALCKGPWAHFLEQFFRWELTRGELAAMVVDEELLTSYLDQRLFTGLAADRFQRIVSEGQWNPPGSHRAGRCLCDKCDRSTSKVGSFSKDGMDVCGVCFPADAAAAATAAAAAAATVAAAPATI